MGLPPDLRADFPILERRIHGRPLIYLDSAATAQKPRQVIEAVCRFYESSNANVHRSIHTLGEEATALYEAARDRVQAFIRAPRREEIVFTRNTTEAINLVARSWGAVHLKAGDEILLTELEHHSNLIPWQLLAGAKGLTLRFIPITDDGYVDLEKLPRLLTERTRLVALAHQSNVLGTILPVRSIVDAAHALGAKILVDAAQSVPHMGVDVSMLGADFVAFSAHKMLGPMGIGVLWARREELDRMEPFLGGGEMIREVWLDHATWNDLPWRFEAGTPNVAGAVGLAAAIAYLERVGMGAIREHEQALTALALEALRREPGMTLYGPLNAADKGGVIAFNLDGIHAHDVAQALDQEGIAVRGGHHCAMPLMRRLGVPGTARASFYLYTTEAEIETFVASLAHVRRLFL